MYNEGILKFVEKLDSSERKSWYELISKKPEIISAEFIKTVDKLNYAQIYDVKRAIKAGLNLETIKIFAKPEFKRSEMGNILNGILGGIELEKIKLYAQKEYANEIWALNEVAKKLDFQILKKYLDLDLHLWQKVEILKYLADNPNVSQQRVDVLCNKRFNGHQVDELENCIKLCEEISIEQLKIIANPEFDNYQMEEIALGYLHKLKNFQVLFYAKPEIKTLKMRYMRLGFENNLSLGSIKYYSSEKIGNFAVKEVYECFIEGLTLEKTRCIVDISRGDENKIYWYRIIAKKYHFSNKDLQELSNATIVTSCMLREIFGLLENGVLLEQVIKYAKRGLDSMQLEEIRKGYENGLSYEEIETYAKRKIHHYQMETLRISLEKGVPIECVEEMAESNMTVKQIELKCAENTDLYELIYQILN